MKKILSVFAIVAMLFASCTPEDQPGNEGGNENEGGTNNGGENTEQEAPELKVTSAATLEFTAEGGEATISYVVKNPVAGTSVSATCDADWVTLSEPTEKKTTLTVAAYDGTEVRTVTVKLAYGESSAEVTVKQNPAQNEDPGTGEETPDVELNATYLFGQYFGNQYSNGYNYYIVLSDNVLEAGDEGLMLAEGHYYILDLYSSVAVGDGELVLPLGTYEYDATSMGEPGTFSKGYSTYCEVSDVIGQKEISGGVITVTENCIEALLKIDGKLHKVVFNGDLLLTMPGGSQGGGSYGGFSNMEGDYSFKHESGFFVAECYGFVDELNQYYWVVQYLADFQTYNGDLFMFELTTDEPSIVGTYKPYNDYMETISYVYVPGYLDEEYNLYGSWLVTLEEGYTTENSIFASIIDGEFTISENDGIYTLDANLIDGIGNAIVGTMIGFGEVYGPEDAAYAKKARKVSAPAKSVVMKSMKNNFVFAR